MISRSTFIEVARAISVHGTCPRLRTAAVLATPEGHIVATGYNGAPAGLPHCTEASCIMEGGHCVRAVHAEMNAILQCALHGVSSRGCTMYCLHRPCVRCALAIVQSGINSIVWERPYDSDGLEDDVLSVFRESRITVYDIIKEKEG